jgi:dihydrodipicolinate synthase/N-acetylneuraminate lyase
MKQSSPSSSDLTGTAREPPRLLAAGIHGAGSLAVVGSTGHNVSLHLFQKGGLLTQAFAAIRGVIIVVTVSTGRMKSAWNGDTYGKWS